MSEFKALTSEELDALYSEDPGIDFYNYSFEEELKKYEDYEPVGYNITIRVFCPPKVVKTKGGIILTDESISKTALNNRFTKGVGLVIKLGKDAYKDEGLYGNSGPLCKPGDWVRFQRNDSKAFSWDKIATVDIDDNRILGITKNPTRIDKLS